MLASRTNVLKQTNPFNALLDGFVHSGSNPCTCAEALCSGPACLMRMAACSRRETLWSFSFRRYRWGGLKGVGDLLWEVPENWSASGAHPLLQAIFCILKTGVPRSAVAPVYLYRTFVKMQIDLAMPTAVHYATRAVLEQRREVFEHVHDVRRWVLLNDETAGFGE